jgi:hypothetical protein
MGDRGGIVRGSEHGRVASDQVDSILRQRRRRITCL